MLCTTGSFGGAERSAELLGEHDLHALGPRVGADPLVLTLGVLEVGLQTRGVHPAGGHEDHPAVAVRLQQRTQAGGQQERAEDMRGERQFVTLLGFLALRRHDAGAMHQPVQPVQFAGQFVGQSCAPNPGR